MQVFMQRDARHNLILHLIESKQITTQTALVSALQSEGVEVTQSSISRDIKQLGLIKVAGIYQSSIRRSSNIDHSLSIDREKSQSNGMIASQSDPHLGLSFLTSVRSAGDHLLVLKTQSATAQAVAMSLDLMAWKEILGTVAGDDTVFVAVAGVSQSLNLQRKLRPFVQK